MNRSLLVLSLFLAACAEVQTVSPGRGVEREEGPIAKVFPSGQEPREDRHGLWRGMDGDHIRWEVRYVRGLPSGPYREWNIEGDLIATWPYNWEGNIEGWMRWYENGESSEKGELTLEMPQPPFDPIGRASELQKWFESRPEPTPEPVVE